MRCYCTFLFLLFTCQITAFCQQGSVKQNVTVLNKDSFVLKEPEIVFIFVQGGSFNFKHLVANPDLVVRVNSFYISKYEITQAQWNALMPTNPGIHGNNDNYPVENVSWEEVQEFIALLNQKTNGRYRLPTEAEWEFAARGGVMSKNYTYSGSNDLDEVAWYKDNSGGHKHLVGEKKPNELGLYDMSGNVEEWCNDWDGHMKAMPISPDNPKGPPDGDDKIYRGGNFEYNEIYPYQALEFHFNFNGRANPHWGHEMIGFRLVRDYP